MSLQATSSEVQTNSQKPETSSLQASPQVIPSSQPLKKDLSSSTKVTFEVPTNSSLPVNPFDPNWIKLWEQVGPISYLALLCTFVWLLTRLVETVKGK